MSEKSGFFDAHKVSGEWDRTYISEDFARYFSSFIGNGVFAKKSNELQVMQSNPVGMSISVASGMSWIDGYYYYNDSELPLPVDNADGSLNRIDIVVCRWSSEDRSIQTVVKKGVAAVSPAAPSIQWDTDIKELQLASITISAGITSITQSLITDTRPNTTVCGWVTSLIDQVDTSTLFRQWQDAYNQEFLNTQNYIAQQKALWDDFFNSVSEDIGLIDGSVTTNKLANGSVTADKLAPGAVKLLFTNVSVSTSAFVADSTYPDYPYRAAIPLTNVLSTMIPEVILGLAEAISGNFAPVSATYDGGVYVYATGTPTSAITIPTIICWEGGTNT